MKAIIGYFLTLAYLSLLALVAPSCGGLEEASSVSSAETATVIDICIRKPDPNPCYVGFGDGSKFSEFAICATDESCFVTTIEDVLPLVEASTLRTGGSNRSEWGQCGQASLVKATFATVAKFGTLPCNATYYQACPRDFVHRASLSGECGCVIPLLYDATVGWTHDCR
jgi:hypothetical protein